MGYHFRVRPWLESTYGNVWLIQLRNNMRTCLVLSRIIRKVVVSFHLICMYYRDFWLVSNVNLLMSWLMRQVLNIDSNLSIQHAFLLLVLSLTFFFIYNPAKWLYSAWWKSGDHHTHCSMQYERHKIIGKGYYLCGWIGRLSSCTSSCLYVRLSCNPGSWQHLCWIHDRMKCILVHKIQNKYVFTFIR